MNLNLIDAGDLVLDRIFDREDLYVRPVESLQGRIQRSGFAGARRPGHEHDPIGLIHQGLECCDSIGIEAKLREVELDPRPVEDAHYDTFPIDRRDRRDAKVDVDAAHWDLDPPVLRHATLSNVELRHDLEARGHGRA